MAWVQQWGFRGPDQNDECASSTGRCRLLGRPKTADKGVRPSVTFQRQGWFCDIPHSQAFLKAPQFQLADAADQGAPLIARAAVQTLRRAFALRCARASSISSSSTSWRTGRITYRSPLGLDSRMSLTATLADLPSVLFMVAPSQRIGDVIRHRPAITPLSANLQNSQNNISRSS